MKKDNSEKLISKSDLILLVVCIMAGIIAVLVIHLNSKTGLYVKVSVDGEEVETFNLDRDTEYVVKTDAGNNKLVIKDRQAYVSDADCPDKICVKHSHISRVGDTIICLPHKLVVEICE